MFTKRIFLLLTLICLMGIQTTDAAKRKAKQITRPKVALVLSGGGAKGAAAIGTLKYIEKAGIPIDYVVGTSAGAIIGSLYAVGYNANEIDSIFRSQNWKKMFSDVAPMRNKLVRLKHFIPGVLSGKHFTETLDSLLHHKDFGALRIPFRAMAVDMNEFKEVCIDSGNVAEAVRASMSVPLAFRPVEKDSMTLVDGGLLNNLPVDVGYKMGADIVIAVDLADPKRAEQEGDSIKKSGLGALLAWQFARPDLQKYQTNRKAATLLIHPDVQGYKGTSFAPEDTEQLIHNGEVAGEAVWEQLVVIAHMCGVKK